MSYPLELGEGRIARAAGSELAAAEVLTSAADHGEDVMLDRVKLYRLKFIVLTLTDGASEVTYTRRPTPGSATGETVVGTLDIPDATAVGTIIFKDVAQILEAGDALELSVSSAASTAGGGRYGYDCSLCPDDHRENAELIESA